MPDPTDVPHDPDGPDADDVARDDPHGLKILDAVQVGGTWMVAEGDSGQDEPRPAETIPEPGGLVARRRDEPPPAEPSPKPGGPPARRRWAAIGGLILLVVALAVVVLVRGATQPRTGSAQAPATVVPSTQARTENTVAPSPPETPLAALPSPQATVPSSAPTPAPTPSARPTPTPSPTDQPTPTPAPTPIPDFTLDVTPDAQAVPVGGTTTYSVSASAVGGFSGSIGLSVTDVPPGVTASFDFTAIDPGSTATLSIVVDADAAPGTYTLTIAGVNDSTAHGQTVALTIY
jgi:hypothetical protein